MLSDLARKQPAEPRTRDIHIHQQGEGEGNVTRSQHSTNGRPAALLPGLQHDVTGQPRSTGREH